MSVHSSELPVAFGEFVNRLRQEHFSVGIDAEIRLHTLLGRMETPPPPERLRSLLCPLFATSAATQASFTRIFNAHFGQAEPEPSPIASTSAVAVLPQPEALPFVRRIKWKWPAWILFVLISFGIIGWFLAHPEAARQWRIRLYSSPSAPTTTIKPEIVIREDPGKEASALPPHGAPSLGRKLYAYRPALFAAAILVPLVICLLFEVMRRRAFVLHRAALAEPPYSWTLSVTPSQIPDYHSPTLLRIARKLRRRLSADFETFDMAATISATISAGGYPALRYSPVRAVPEYLVLIESASPRDHMAALFERLASRLAEEDVLIDRYFFEGDPRCCWRRRSSESLSLFDLRHQFPNHRLLIFVDAESLIDPVTGEPASWSGDLLDWLDCAVFTAKPKSLWGSFEAALEQGGISLHSASLAGVESYADSREETALNLIAAVSSRQPLHGEESLSHLRTALGDRLFQLLGACAIYPELHWDLTLHLAKVLDSSGHALSEADLLHLSRLPWFRAGIIPDAIRVELIQSLGSVVEINVRTEIVGLFAQTAAPTAASAAYTKRQLSFAVQSALVHRHTRGAFREALRSLPKDAIERDSVVLRIVEGTPADRLGIILPQHLHRVLFDRGLPFFGPSIWVRALLTLVAIGVMCVAIRHFVPSIRRGETVVKLGFVGDPTSEVQSRLIPVEDPPPASHSASPRAASASSGPAPSLATNVAPLTIPAEPSTPPSNVTPYPTDKASSKPPEITGNSSDVVHVQELPETPSPASVDMPNGPVFEYGSAQLTPGGKQNLAKLATLIKRNPNAIFSIESHTDTFGTAEYNLALSQKQAEAVKQFLVESLGIAPERIQTKGFGKTRPIVPSGTKEEQAPNRRVEIVIKTNPKK